MCDDCYMLRRETEELRSEINRHHRDFKCISTIVHEALGSTSGITRYDAREYEQALKLIRNIVG